MYGLVSNFPSVEDLETWKMGRQNLPGHGRHFLAWDATVASRTLGKFCRGSKGNSLEWCHYHLQLLHCWVQHE